MGGHGPRYISHTYPHSSYHGETSRTITLLRIDRGPFKRHRETAPVFRYLSSLRLIAISFAPLVLSYKLSHFSKSVEVCRQRELPPSSAVRALAAKSLFIAGSYPLWRQQRESTSLHGSCGGLVSVETNTSQDFLPSPVH